mmetsp:Transcript_143/g.563  ORF Transcript_143/g.563 Transcript_143/m.563 type:complete len:251 (+) Transcript_143:2603-3355(+)
MIDGTPLVEVSYKSSSALARAARVLTHLYARPFLTCFFGTRSTITTSPEDPAVIKPFLYDSTQFTRVRASRSDAGSALLVSPPPRCTFNSQTISSPSKTITCPVLVPMATCLSSPFNHRCVVASRPSSFTKVFNAFTIRGFTVVSFALYILNTPPAHTALMTPGSCGENDACFICKVGSGTRCAEECSPATVLTTRRGEGSSTAEPSTTFQQTRACEVVLYPSIERPSSEKVKPSKDTRSPTPPLAFTPT